MTTSPSTGAAATADLLVVDADVITLDATRPRASAVAVAGGVVVDVGGQEVVERWRGSRTEVVALGGAALTPGWVDGHSHPVGSLTMSAGADLTAVRTLEQLREQLGRLARESTDGWVQGWGLVPDAFPGGVPRADLVDDALGGARALLRMADVHSALASTSLLRAAGIDGPRRFPSASEVVCDPDGTPTGFLLEWDAVALAEHHAPALPDDQLRSRLRSLLDDMAAQGLVGAQVMDGDAASLDLLDRLEDGGDLPLRLRVAPFCMPGVDDDGLAELVAWQQRAGRRWRVAGVKLMIDGTVDGGTAWLEHPDANGQSTASFWREPQAYARAVRALDAAGVPTVTHAIGDGGVRFVLDVLEPLGPPEAADGHGARGARGRRRAAHRLEHLETLPDDLVARIGASGLTASLQPTHCSHFVAADGKDNWSVRLGPERAGRGWRVHDLLEAGALVVLGSDWPVADFDARAIMASAQLRRRVEDDDAPPVGPGQAISAAAALAGFTRAPALAAGDADRGAIRVGAAADLTAVGVDPTAVPPADLAAAPVLMTVVGGAPVHRAL